MNKTISVIVIILILILCGPVYAASGKKLYHDKQCDICHGVTGKEKIKGMPYLAGQQEKYLFNQIKDILTQKRINNHSQLMQMNYTLEKQPKGTLEKKLTISEIKTLSRYLAGLK